MPLSPANTMLDPAESMLKNVSVTDIIFVACGSALLCEICAEAKPSTDNGAVLPTPGLIKTESAYTFFRVAIMLRVGENCPCIGFVTQKEKLYI